MLENHELEQLGMKDYEQRVAASGMELLRMPVVDGCVPSSMRETREMIDALLERLARGARVVVHDRRGRGRAGLLGGCVLVASGHCDGAGALERLAERCDPTCLETPMQRAFVEQFAKRAA